MMTMSAFVGRDDVYSSDDHQHHQRVAASLWSLAFDVEAAVGNSSQPTIAEHHATADFVLLSAVAASEASECDDFDGFLSGVDSMIDAVDTRMIPYPGTMRDVSWWEAVIKVTFYVILFFVSLVGNVFVVWTVYRNRTMRSPTTYYLVNLAICDLMVTLLCVWVHLVVDLTEGWVFGAFFCKFSSFAQGKISLLNMLVKNFQRIYSCFRGLVTRIMLRRLPAKNERKRPVTGSNNCMILSQVVHSKEF